MKNKKDIIIIAVVGVVIIAAIIVGIIVVKSISDGNQKQSEPSSNKINTSEETKDNSSNSGAIDKFKEYGSYELPTLIKEIELPESSGSSESETINGSKWECSIDKDGNAINVRITDRNIPENIVVPSEIKGHKVISVGGKNADSHGIVWLSDSALKSVKTITVPDGVLYITHDAFKGFSGLESITLPDSIVYIGDEALSYNENLMRVNSNTDGEVNLPKSLQSYGKGIFEYCNKINKFSFPSQINYINRYTFSNCEGFGPKLEITGQYEYILGGAFSDIDTLETLVIDDGVKYVDGFKLCSNLKEVYLPNSVEAIESGAFYTDFKIKTFKYNGKLKYLGSEIFEGKWNNIVDINNFIKSSQLP